MPHAIKRHHASATRHNKGPCRVTRHQNVASELGVVGDLVGHHRAGSGADAGAAGELQRQDQLVIQQLQDLRHSLLSLIIELKKREGKEAGAGGILRTQQARVQ